MYTLTGRGRDRGDVEVVVITCSACGYFEEHFTGPGLSKVGKRCARCSR